ncbi:MAG TPA: PQQ-binding-like beta-propeller repeat protein [Ktedonobacteraceae bacterium]|nr:PQQ-binding-like beta-propeller repeat protein [Ktedonobacteraceae bacterium]
MEKRPSERSHLLETPEASQSQKPLSERRRSRRTLVLAITFAAFIIANTIAVAFVLHGKSQSAQASGGEPTPTVPIPTSSIPIPMPPGSLYTVAAGSLARIDLRTSNTKWTLDEENAAMPLVLGNKLFFNGLDSSGSLLKAVSVSTGQTLWSSSQYPNGFLLGAGNMLYDSFCDFSSGSCSIDGINASNAALLWSYDLPHGNGWIALQNNVIYGVSYTSYFALNASTGAPIWQKDLLQYTDQESVMTPTISGNMLSFASCNTTKQSSGFPGCYLYAFDARTGNELWHMPSDESIMASPSILNGVVYAGTIQGTLYAVKGSTGATLWTAQAGGMVGQVTASGRTIYVEMLGSDGQSFSVEALDAVTHTVRWGGNGNQATTRPAPGSTIPLVQRFPASLLSAGPASHPFVLDHGLIYIQTGPNSIDVLLAFNGSLVKEFSVSSVSSFTVSIG